MIRQHSDALLIPPLLYQYYMSPNMDVTLQLQIASESRFASFTLTFRRLRAVRVICEP